MLSIISDFYLLYHGTHDTRTTRVFRGLCMSQIAMNFIKFDNHIQNLIVDRFTLAQQTWYLFFWRVSAVSSAGNKNLFPV